MENNTQAPLVTNQTPVDPISAATPSFPKKSKLKFIIPVVVVVLLVLFAGLFTFVLNNSKQQNANIKTSESPTPEASGQTVTTDYKPQNPTLVELLNSIKTKDKMMIKKVPDPAYVGSELGIPFVWYDKEDYLVMPGIEPVIISLNKKADIATVANDAYNYFIAKGFTENVLNTTKLKLQYLQYQEAKPPASSWFSEISLIAALEKGNQKCMVMGALDISSIASDTGDSNVVKVDCSVGDYTSQKNSFLENAYASDGTSLIAIKLNKKDDNFAIGENDQGFMSVVQILKKEGDKWVVVWEQWGQQPVDCSNLTKLGLTESDISALGIKNTNGQCQ
jgi:hypothetical protein